MGHINSLAPIVLFCYNRPWHLKQTIESLQANVLAPRSELFVFSDGPKKESDIPLIKEIRAYLPKIKGFKKIYIIEAEQNKGLANSVISGVSDIVGRFGKVIVLEDDMLSTVDFLDFMNEALTMYESRQDIFSISGYTPPLQLPENLKHGAYLAPRASSWGWGTWAAKWQKADWDVSDFSTLKKDSGSKKRLATGGSDLWPMLQKQQQGIIDSWAIRWTYAQHKNNAYGLYPVRSKIKNIGTDGSGTNFTFKSGIYGREMAEGHITLDPDLQPDKQIIEIFRNYYNLPFQVKIKNWIKYRI
ncbi:glycosyltransferase [Dyadobacter luticola]|uniref:Glycosyltransferase n=1 Tax=Dyadobacter luticola TaxID=1979387 RepID=A0A5R9KXG0_9BACT|nr:glycosyltransferase [Dyadobacter luticola]TLV00953.1 glycosyltransferase [Dyadobacter luticola]